MGEIRIASSRILFSSIHGCMGLDPPQMAARFYSPQHVYQVMKRIHEFDAALREAYEFGGPEGGVHFIQKDPSNRLIPCSPNKLLFSDVVSIRPGQRLVLSGFQTVYKSRGTKNLKALDSRVEDRVGSSQEPVLIDVAEGIELLKLAYDNLEFDDVTDDDREAHIIALGHLSRTCKKPHFKGKMWLLVAKDRDVARYREEGRFSNAPDTKQQMDLVRTKADDVPVLMLLRQKGDEGRGWRGLPFWWPVIMTPRSGVTAIFAMGKAVTPTAPAPSSGATRSPATEETA